MLDTVDTVLTFDELGRPPRRALVNEIQQRLGEVGLLDPPADGMFGPVSAWALTSFKSQSGTESEAGLGPQTAKALLAAKRAKLFPLALGTDLASRIVRAMDAAGHWLCLHPETRNIIYFEGVDESGALNDDAPDVFNDLRLVIGFRGGKPVILGSWVATTEPGKFFTVKPMQPTGAARIAFGQYKAWRVGTHPSNTQAHEALVQVDTIKIHRDLNKDFDRKNDKIFVGSTFGINQHWGFDHPVNFVGKASAGCLVGRTKQGHREFMALVKDDPRFRASNGYTFMTAVLDGAQLP